MKGLIYSQPFQVYTEIFSGGEIYGENMAADSNSLRCGGADEFFGIQNYFDK